MVSIAVKISKITSWGSRLSYNKQNVIMQFDDKIGKAANTSKLLLLEQTDKAV
jgi:hypothetical protein